MAAQILTFEINAFGSPPRDASKVGVRVNGAGFVEVGLILEIDVRVGTSVGITNATGAVADGAPTRTIGSSVGVGGMKSDPHAGRTGWIGPSGANAQLTSTGGDVG